jgi:hypothetical protein
MNFMAEETYLRDPTRCRFAKPFHVLRLSAMDLHQFQILVWSTRHYYWNKSALLSVEQRFSSSFIDNDRNASGMENQWAIRLQKCGTRMKEATIVT